ncbi:MAG TPA: hypothetical protein VLE73_00590 [Candidatus Saccharimonadales bacterium]|nr:hypothetical protein [Candidatus Saccharimonadales bacterium]
MSYTRFRNLPQEIFSLSSPTPELADALGFVTEQLDTFAQEHGIKNLAFIDDEQATAPASVHFEGFESDYRRAATKAREQDWAGWALVEHVVERPAALLVVSPRVIGNFVARQTVETHSSSQVAALWGHAYNIAAREAMLHAKGRLQYLDLPSERDLVHMAAVPVGKPIIKAL